MSIRHRRGRRAAAVALVAALAVALTGCQLIGDALEGQRIVNERLEVERALSALADEISEIDGVESVDSGFDPADLSSQPGFAVELASTEFALWHDVVARVGAAGESEVFTAHPVSVSLRSGLVGAEVNTEYGVADFTEQALRVATDAAAAFPGAPVSLMSGGASAVYLTVPDAPEDVLSRLDDDPVLVRLLDDAQGARVALNLSADGLDLSGVPGPELVQWARDRFASGAPRMALNGGEPQTEWMLVSISRYDGVDSVAGTWASSAVPGEGGAMWDAFVAALRAGPPHPASGDGCVPAYLSYNWPGLGQMASVVASCDEAPVVQGSPDRPALATLRDALAAEGIHPEDFGFTLA